MVLLLAVAVMSVAVASWIIATTFRLRIRENTTQLTQVRAEITACADRLRQAEKRLRSQSDHDQARWADEFEMVRQQIGEAHVQLARHDAELRQHEDRLGDQEEGGRRLTGMAEDVRELSRHVDELRQHLRAQLDREVAVTRASTSRRILAGGIYAEQPAAARVLPVLYDSLVEELRLETLFRDSPDRFAGRCYLAWSAVNGESLEARLDALLRACPWEGAGDGGGDEGAAPGLGELRRLLLALHRAGPATIQVGPLVLFRTADQLAGAVLAGPEASLLDDQSTLPPPEECRKLLSGLGEGRLADLGAWADGQGS